MVFYEQTSKMDFHLPTIACHRPSIITDTLKVPFRVTKELQTFTVATSAIDRMLQSSRHPLINANRAAEVRSTMAIETAMTEESRPEPFPILEVGITSSLRAVITRHIPPRHRSRRKKKTPRRKLLTTGPSLHTVEIMRVVDAVLAIHTGKGPAGATDGRRSRPWKVTSLRGMIPLHCDIRTGKGPAGATVGRRSRSRKMISLRGMIPLHRDIHTGKDLAAATVVRRLKPWERQIHGECYLYTSTSTRVKVR